MMNKGLIIALVFISIIILYLTSDDILMTKENVLSYNEPPELITQTNRLVKIKTKDNFYLYTKSGYLALTKDKSSAEIFKVHSSACNTTDPNDLIDTGNTDDTDEFNGIALESTVLKKFVNIKYTVAPSGEYDVTVEGKDTRSNDTQLEITHNGKYFYIKFFNDTYMSMDRLHNLYSINNKSNIVCLKFIKCH